MANRASLDHPRHPLDPSPDHVSPCPATDPEKHGIPLSNDKGAAESTCEASLDGATGVNKAEAAALIWSKNALYAMYAW